MGKKKTQNAAKQKHPQQSFQQLVAMAAMNVVKPYAEELFQNLADDLSMRIFRRQANIQTRIMAVESLLITKYGLTEPEIENAVMDVEDEATGYTPVTRGAQAEDLIRLSVRTKAKDGEWSEPVKKQVTRLMNKPLSLGSETVESAVLGMVTGEAKNVNLEDDFLVELKIDRVSEPPPKPKAPEAPAPEAAPAEAKDESPNA